MYIFLTHLHICFQLFRNRLFMFKSFRVLIILPTFFNNHGDKAFIQGSGRVNVPVIFNIETKIRVVTLLAHHSAALFFPLRFLKAYYLLCAADNPYTGFHALF